MKQLLTTILVFSITSSCFSDEKLLVGILDHPQCNKNQDFNVRVLFGKNQDEFIPIDNKSIADTFKTSNVKWFIAFDGKIEDLLKAMILIPHLMVRGLILAINDIKLNLLKKYSR